ncbi:hypothetical protein FOZ62_021628 [Perkinsus olseni]|uniref:Uncharacterized protein n=1 Tax=Perkinsus olseni TaxID=32597 RepID=A0A7J6RLT1_PEROL|nr:hypothetical protein FOZ62_021628 [Perkinsus olseni]
MVQALSESLPTIVSEKKKISTSRRALDDLYALPGFTKPAALKDRKKQKNILKQNRKHRNLATGAVHGFTRVRRPLSSDYLNSIYFRPVGESPRALPVFSPAL